MEQPAILYFARSAPTTDTIRKALRGEGFRVVHSDEDAEAVGQLMDERVGLLLLDGGALTPFTERLFRQWREHDPLLEAVGLAAGSDRTEPALVRMDCRRIVRPPLDADEVAEAARAALDQRARRAQLVRGDEEIASLVLQSTMALVTAVVRCWNQGMGWNEEGNSVGTEWGHGPSLCEGLPLQMEVSHEQHSAELYPLRPDGSRAASIAGTTKEAGVTLFGMSPEHKTLWYELVIGD